MVLPGPVHLGGVLVIRLSLGHFSGSCDDTVLCDDTVSCARFVRLPYCSFVFLNIY